MPQSIKVLVDGGKASAGPPLGPALGPTGINVGQVVSQINEKTKDFSGMRVPVEVIIDPSTKSFEIKTGSPPVSQMILKELGLQKLSGNAKYDKVGNMAIEQMIKIANSKMDGMNCLEAKSAVKTVMGSCVSLGVLVEGLEPNDAIKKLDSGAFDKEISEGKTEVSAEKKQKLQNQMKAAKDKLQKQLDELKKEEEAAAAEAEVEAAAEGEKPEGEKKEGEKPEGEKKEGGKPEGGEKPKPKEEKKE